MLLKLYEELKRNIEAETTCALVTVVAGEAETGAQMIVFPDGRTSGDLGRPDVTAWCSRSARRLMREDRSVRLHMPGCERSGCSRSSGHNRSGKCSSRYSPPARKMSSSVGWTRGPVDSVCTRTLGFHVTIVDGRARFATRERFPSADEIIVAWPEEALEKLEIDRFYLCGDPHATIPSSTFPRLRRWPNCHRTARALLAQWGRRRRGGSIFAELRARGVTEEFLKRCVGPLDWTRRPVASGNGARHPCGNRRVCAMAAPAGLCSRANPRLGYISVDFHRFPRSESMELDHFLHLF